MISLQNFDVVAKKYKDNNLIKEIYSTDDYKICNVANSMYVIFFDVRDGYISGYAIDTKNVERIVQYPEYCQKLLTAMNDQGLLEENAVTLGDYNYQALCNIKQQTDTLGPRPGIDLDMEQRIIDENRKEKGGIQL